MDLAWLFAPSPTATSDVPYPTASMACTALATTGAKRKPPAAPPLTLADVERQLVASLGPLPPDTKRRLARAELKRLKHCETVRQSRVRKKVALVPVCMPVSLLYPR
jgi:hypothetical protein